MSGKTTAFSQGLMQAILTAVFSSAEISSLLANAASPITNLYLSLHTADPGIGGNQTTNEAAYTGYARVAISRVAGSWTISGESASLVANASFPAPTGGTLTACTYVGVGQSSSGSGQLMYSGLIGGGGLTPTVGTPPIIAAGSTITEA